MPSPRLEALGIDNGEDFWNLVRANLEKFNDSVGWATMFNAPMAGQIADEDAEFCALAASTLPGDISAETWSAWTGSLKEQTGRKGKTLFMPLRPRADRALSRAGNESGFADARREKSQSAARR